MTSQNGHQPWDEARVRAVIESRAHLPGAMLPVLHAVQDAFGYIDERAIPLVADVLNVSRAEVVGVIHFYHDFRTTPPGRHLLKICRAEACQSMGSDALAEHVTATLGVQMGGTTADGRYTVEAVYCLGNCALSPAAMLDRRLLGRVTPARADEILAGMAS
jgi:formate dehydrogenase subunit gamma